MEELTARYFDIKKFAVHDGPGIRTTLFLKGCPLHCVWCHNPESISCRPQLAFLPQKCIGCGECARVCGSGAVTISGEALSYDRGKCTVCGKCAEVCLGEARRLYGKTVTVSEAETALLADKSFYDASKGGVTVSGGEPLLQADFVAALFARLKESGVHTAVDTCGCVPFSEFEKVLPYTDMFLYDVKHTDPGMHRKYCGRENGLILENLARLDKTGKDIEIRIPFVPGVNTDDETVTSMGRLFASCRHISRVKILPYHSMARSKYTSVGMEDTLPSVDSPSDEMLDRAAEIMCAMGVGAVNGRKS